MSALRVLRSVPLLGFALLAANLLALLGESFHTDLLKFGMVSGETLVLRAGDLLVLAALVLLYVEIYKAARGSAVALIDHIASLLVFAVALVEFLLLPRFAHAGFLSLVVICLLDVLAGFVFARPIGRGEGADGEPLP